MPGTNVVSSRVGSGLAIQFATVLLSSWCAASEAGHPSAISTRIWFSVLVVVLAPEATWR